MYIEMPLEIPGVNQTTLAVLRGRRHVTRQNLCLRRGRQAYVIEPRAPGAPGME
jgi:hypothetical protein